jgi:hypothetical protein
MKYILASLALVASTAQAASINDVMTALNSGHEPTQNAALAYSNGAIDATRGLMHCADRDVQATARMMLRLAEITLEVPIKDGDKLDAAQWLAGFMSHQFPCKRV